MSMKLQRLHGVSVSLCFCFAECTRALKFQNVNAHGSTRFAQAGVHDMI
jgi:hypothetical protein